MQGNDCLAVGWRQGRPGVSGMTGRLGKVFRIRPEETAEEHSATVFSLFCFCCVVSIRYGMCMALFPCEVRLLKGMFWLSGMKMALITVKQSFQGKEPLQ
jgi:hypothetical protein